MSNIENFKISLKFSVIVVITLEPRGITSRNFFTWRAARQAWQYRYKFWVVRTSKIWEGKNRPKLGAILDNIRLWSRMSARRRTYRQAENGRNLFPKKKTSELWSTKYKVYAASVCPRNPPKINSARHFGQL